MEADKVVKAVNPVKNSSDATIQTQTPLSFSNPNQTLERTGKAVNLTPSTAIRRNKRSFYDSLGSSDDNTPSKAGKKIPKRKAKPKAKESTKDSTPKDPKPKKDVNTTRGLFFFTEKAKHRFGDNKIITSGGNKKMDKESMGLNLPENSTLIVQSNLQVRTLLRSQI